MDIEKFIEFMGFELTEFQKGILKTLKEIPPSERARLLERPQRGRRILNYHEIRGARVGVVQPYYVEDVNYLEDRLAAAEAKKPGLAIFDELAPGCVIDTTTAKCVHCDAPPNYFVICPRRALKGE